jgi:alkylated DNA repair dioxygenase AlkB
VSQQELFASQSGLPDGLTYVPEFIDALEEQGLLERIRALPFQQAQYRRWQARRRIVSFGGRYDFARHELSEAPPIPEFLQPLRARIGAWAGIDAGNIAHAMIAEYQPGTPLGWHRDVPDFEEILGVSLQGCARMRLRPWPPKAPARAAHAIELAPRSAYVMRGVARWGWQHAISPTHELRYSITFRTRRH